MVVVPANVSHLQLLYVAKTGFHPVPVLEHCCSEGEINAATLTAHK